MSQQVKFFKANKIDLNTPNITLTVTDGVATSTGQAIVNRIRNRKNTSAWRTTESTDAAGTTLEVSMGDQKSFDTLMLIKHNFKAYDIKYWDGFAYVAFDTPIIETVNADSVTTYSFPSVTSAKLLITISSTQVVDADKELYQLIVTEIEGQLEAFPKVRPTHVRSIQKTTMLSGKINMIESLGRLTTTLNVDYWRSDADLTLVEKLYFGRLPMLVWLCGGDELQYSSRRMGYRLEDIYLMRPTNNYKPKWYADVYTTGLDIDIVLDEVID